MCGCGLQVLDVRGGRNWEPEAFLALAAALKGMQQLSKLRIPEVCNADVPAIEELIGALATLPQLGAVSLSSCRCTPSYSKRNKTIYA